MKKAVIIGAGPAGLTAAYELLQKSREYEVTVLEESSCIGGISRTVSYRGNRMDMGGHRFFSRMPEVNEWWEKILPLQGSPSRDDRMLEREVPLQENGPDPEKTDRVMLKRRRVSRILFDRKFYDYPISLKTETLKNLGFSETMKVGFSYLRTLVHKLPEDNLENFYINRFGRRLYELFFEYYTENLWGRHPRDIDASWGAQRVKGISVGAVLRDMFGKAFHRKNRRVETSLIEEFKYPKLGPGELWELAADEIRKMGGTILMNAEAVQVHKNPEGLLDRVVYRQDGKDHILDADLVISSMPLKDLAAAMNDVPEEIADIAAGLPYRDYMTLGVLLRSLNLKNETKIRTVGDIVPDCWVYVQDRNVKMGRFQIYNNWSPYLVSDPEHTVWAGLEYFVNEGDEYWNMTEEEFSAFAVSEMLTLGLIRSREDVLDSHLERVKKAYPAYFDTYSEIGQLVSWLSEIPNLYCVGRNGQHRYNNLDHSMATSFEAVRLILSGGTDKSAMWSVNTEQEYHEEKTNRT